MENNTNSNLLSLLGFQAYSLDFENSSLQQFVNKTYENGKQNINNDITSMSDINNINNSLLNTLNMIDSSIKNETPVQSDNTYTLDDLLDLENEDMNAANLFDGSLEDDSSFHSMSSDVPFIEAAIASPLSSSSEESCDLDDILFFDETPSLGNPVMETSEIGDANKKAVQNDHQYSVESTEQALEQPSLIDFLNSNGTDLSSLCSLLFQNQAIAIPEEPQDELMATISEPSSPSSSESESESVRYKPYKKPKTQEQKLRKKAQNRTAATRYRIKKKDELKAMVEEADELEKTNKELKGKVDGLKTEIDYLKNLMLDVIKARLAKGASPQNLLSVVKAQ